MRFRSHIILSCSAVFSCSSFAHAQTIQSTVLQDKIYRGDGVIDLLRNISSNNLATYFNQTGGLLLLGADINESAEGNENNSSVGIAIKSAQLAITTTAGDFTFRDFFTSTTSMLRGSGSSSASQYFTMFGQGGSSQITGTGSVDISRFDDVMWFENVTFNGAVTSAKLRISFLDVPRSQASTSESFFDFSGGFEDFALFSAADAVLLEEANIGMQGAPSGLVYSGTRPATTAIRDALALVPVSEEPSGQGSSSGPGSAPGSTPVSTPPAAPAPPFVALASMAALILWKKRNSLRTADS